MSEEEKQAIEYLKARLYGNEGCKIIDVAQSDLRIFLKLVENLQKDIASWKKYCNEQENDITLKNNKICDLEFKIEKQSKEIEELEEYANWHIEHLTEDIADYIDDDKKGNASIIGEFKEEREHWKDIIRIMNNEKTYIDYKNY